MKGVERSIKKQAMILDCVPILGTKFKKEEIDLITSEQIRNDLREIRYYYARKDKLALPIKKIAEKYNSIVREAPLRLYDVYACLYIRGQTQEELASELGYTPQYIRKMIIQLLAYFKKKLNETEVNNGAVHETFCSRDPSC